MKKRPYKRKQGDQEIRILCDGRLVMIAPDETLLEIAKNMDSLPINKQDTKENETNARG